jgi:hypothetical protein
MSHIQPIGPTGAGPRDYFDTMHPGWLWAAADELINGADVSIFDYRRGGGRWIYVPAAPFHRHPNRPVLPALKLLLRAEGVSPARFRR